MANGAKIASIACLVLAVLLYMGSINKHLQHEGNPNVLMYFSGIFVIVATLIEIFHKDSKLDLRDVLNLIAVILAVLLLFLSSSRNWGLLAASLIVGISILTSVQFVV